MAIQKTITLPTGVTCNYHRIRVEFVPSPQTEVQIRHQAWINQAARQVGNEPLFDDIFVPIKTTTETNELGETIQKLDIVSLLSRQVPAGSTTIRDAATKAAYTLVKAYYAALADGTDV